jgi:hypothetical protein
VWIVPTFTAAILSNAAARFEERRVFELIDPCPALLTGVATASASFPPLIGPLTMKVGDEKTYWHAGTAASTRTRVWRR